ncbi:MAG: rod shape-determining protein RodA [Bacteroidales bacterium]|nr:rod shape-determining protein RodA [Bacteroidales bacterium]
MGNSFKIGKIDMPLVLCYLFLIFVGWINIFASVYSEEHSSIFDMSQRYGMQFIWILTALVIAGAILFALSHKIYSVLAPPIYVAVCLLLFAVIFLGKEVNGSRSWFEIGPVSFQPAEISKISTSLFLAYIMSKYSFRLGRMRDAVSVAVAILLPMALIVMEKETGSALVYCGFIFLLYREGLSGWFILYGLMSILLFVVTLAVSPLAAIIILFLLHAIINGIYTGRLMRHLLLALPVAALLWFLPSLHTLINLEYLNGIKPEYIAVAIILAFAIFCMYKLRGKRGRHMKLLFLSLASSIALVFSVEFIFQEILQPHQRARIENLLGITEDLKGAGYNVHQSKIAIGSGGMWGKGFLDGTQTKFNFVPEQSTDFIFCTVGEEWGFAGSVAVIAVYLFLITRLIVLSERQKDNFTRIYGYCVACCFFMHVFINIGMTMGLVPVIGIPLPLLSYGGSSLWSFTVLLFIFIRLDMERWKY